MFSLFKRSTRVPAEIGKIYTLEDIVVNLDLKDTPFLRFVHQHWILVIQDDHVRVKAILTNEQIAKSLWVFEAETRAGAPLFMYAGENIYDLVTLTPRPGREDESWWVCFKGFEVKQPCAK